MTTKVPIAFVKNNLKEKAFVKNAEQIISEIVVDDHFADGLFRIEEQKFLDVIFGFDRSDDYQLVTRIFNGETRGVFASRSPHRPNGMGITTVYLRERKGNVLIVSGLDALDGTPVYDLKPTDFSFYRNLEAVDDSTLSRPRFNIEKHISRSESRALLQQAGQLHGHYCPGLALGVLAAMHGMEQFRHLSDGMEDLLAIVETNNCFSDGVQYVTGCTFGNNALIFKDYGKNAVAICDREGKGFRIRARNDMRAVVDQLFPEFNRLFEKVVVKRDHRPEFKQKFRDISQKASFGLLDIPFDDLFEVKETKATIPDYASIEQSLVCEKCGEMFMASRGHKQNDVVICNSCLDIRHPFLDGYGIHCS